MDQPDIGREIEAMPVEPLLRIEKQLIGWSLGLGLALLVILVFLSGARIPAL